MPVFTIYNCGTNFDESDGDKKGELIARMYKQTIGIRAEDKLICAGPGSTLMNRWGYDPAKEPADYKFSRLRVDKGIYQLFGEVKGDVGAKDQVKFNVNRVLEILKGLDPKPGTVNMAGWSRGACTCHAMANAMDGDGDLSGVVVNIFAFDPVPGPERFGLKDWRIVPKNVANYHAIFMENENRSLMNAAHLLFASRNTQRDLLHMPGSHSNAVQKETGFEEVAMVGGHLAAQSLRAWGTKFVLPTSFLRSDGELLEYYARMIMKTKKFFEKGGDQIYRWTGSNQAWFKMPNHLLSKSPYFVNFHHKRVFKKVAPKVYKYFFEFQVFDETKSFDVYRETAVERFAPDVTTGLELAQELDYLESALPKTYETLHHFAKYVAKPRAKALKIEKKQKKEYGEYKTSLAAVFKAA